MTNTNTTTTTTFYKGKTYEWKIYSKEELGKLRDDDGKLVFPKKREEVE